MTMDWVSVMPRDILTDKGVLLHVPPHYQYQYTGPLPRREITGQDMRMLFGDSTTPTLGQLRTLASLMGLKGNVAINWQPNADVLQFVQAPTEE